MAKIVVVRLTCDRCGAEGKPEVDGAESVAFGYENFSYGLDLCADHAADFHKAVQNIIRWSSDRSRVGVQRRGRHLPGGTSPAAASGDETVAVKRTPADKERLKAIRDWARLNGHPGLGDRGRIPQTVVDEYDAAAS
ncbi:MAG: Lsr2 family DNA-binding protein [Acidimicrobiales bacterium]